MDRTVKRYRNRAEKETHMTMTLYSNREKDRQEDHPIHVLYMQQICDRVYSLLALLFCHHSIVQCIPNCSCACFQRCLISSKYTFQFYLKSTTVELFLYSFCYFFREFLNKLPKTICFVCTCM